MKKLNVNKETESDKSNADISSEVLSLDEFVHDSITSFSLAVVKFEKEWKHKHKDDSKSYPISQKRRLWNEMFSKFVKNQEIE